MFTPTGSATSSPLLNYGQSQLGQAGGTPLTMRSGGMSRLGYQEGGMGMTQLGAPQEEPIFPRLETLNQNLGQAEQTLGSPSNNQFNISPMTSAFTGRSQMNLGGRMSYQEGGMDQMMQQAPQIDPSQIDPRRALELIIQMLIDQGIPPEQAREIAIQMVQAVAEGGMGEMSDERVEARFGGRIGYASGGIGSLVDREGYFLGSVFKGIGKAFKGITKAVKSIVKSDLGKAALAAAAIYATGGGALFGGPGFGSAGTLFGTGGALGSGGAASNFLFGSPVGGFGLEAVSTPGLFGVGGNFAPMSGNLFGSNSILSGLTSGFAGGGGGGGILSSLGGNALGSFAGGLLGGTLAGGMPEQQPGESDEDYKRRVAEYRLQYEQALNNPNPKFATGLYPNNPFYPQRAANGGRIGYQEGGITDLVKQITQQEFFGRPAMAMGGEIPVRENQVGVQELDYRKTGGFVPPIGIKEKADDIPAMLSNNEFVFTADAVRNAGGGNVNKGAERMYGLMKNLENGGRV
jgi:hypothetical protein